MTREELMIGDWLLWDNTIPCIVTTIGCDYIETTKCGITLAESHLLQGVPLTAEILEQNGFERVNGEYQDVFYIYDGIELLIDNVYTLFGQCKMPIKYVHELQHALRLCGINKEIEI